jgi:hypothetical protein
MATENGSQPKQSTSNPVNQSRIESFFKSDNNSGSHNYSWARNLPPMVPAAATRTDKLFAELSSTINTFSTTATSTAPATTKKGTKPNNATMPPPPVPNTQKVPRFLCRIRPEFDVEREFDPEELEEDEMETFIEKRREDAKKYNEKPSSEFPGYPWVVSELAEWLHENYFIEVQMRDQDKFGMHIYNDYTSYGFQEVIENVVRLW